MTLDDETIARFVEALQPGIEKIIDRRMEAHQAANRLKHGFGLQPGLVAPEDCDRVSEIMQKTLAAQGEDATMKGQSEQQEGRIARACAVNPYSPPDSWTDAEKWLMQSVFIRMIGFGHISQASVLAGEVPILAPYPREPMQFMEYAEGGHYGFHADDDEGNAEGRALSMGLLVDGAEEGGEFQFREVPFTAPFDTQIAARGNAIAFRPAALHGVTTVTAGVRRSIVLWMDSLAARQAAVAAQQQAKPTGD